MRILTIIDDITNFKIFKFLSNRSFFFSFFFLFLFIRKNFIHDTKIYASLDLTLQVLRLFYDLEEYFFQIFLFFFFYLKKLYSRYDKLWESWLLLTIL